MLIPSAHSPLKSNLPIAEAKHRIRMLEILTIDLDAAIVIDDWETRQDGPGYTIDMLQYIKKKYPNYDLSLLMGADQLKQFHHWKDFENILTSTAIIGFNRNDSSFTPPPEMNLKWIEEFQVDISSTDIRNKLSNGELPEEELMPPVAEYIRKNNLYGYY